MPVLFLGHGTPMNAIEENRFVSEFRNLGGMLPKPNAILCISAHWETDGTKITAMEYPETIHDFGGFPRQLYQVQYPAPGNPALASEVKELITTSQTQLTTDWGLDHGAWSVIKHLYPDADVSTIQLSLDYRKSPKAHFEMAKELRKLRRKGVLIVGSGNIVHNLRMVSWRNLSGNTPYGYDWATETKEEIKTLLQNGHIEELMKYHSRGRAFNLSIPTPEHYLPLLYAVALKSDDERITFFNDELVGGSIAMTSLVIS